MKASTVSLIVGLAIPVVMVIAIAAAILIPARYLHPKTDFIYAIGQYPSYTSFENNQAVEHDFSVIKGVLTDNATPLPPQQPYYPYQKDSTPHFYRHHTESDTNEELTAQEVTKLSLSDTEQSADGFTVSYGTSSGGFFPFYYEGTGDKATGYLSNGTASKKISITTKANTQQFTFVGWVQ